MSSITFTLTEGASGLQSDPESANVVSPDTALLFVLVGKAAEEYMLVGYTSTDRLSQLSPPQISPDGVQMIVVDANSQAGVINVTVEATHRKHGTRHLVDPQLTNFPPD